MSTKPPIIPLSACIHVLLSGVVLFLLPVAGSAIAATQPGAVEIWYEDNNMRVAGGLPDDFFERYEEGTLSQWAVSRSMMDTYYLRQNTFRNHFRGNSGFQQMMADAHNAEGTTLAYDCVTATWAHHRNDYETPDFTSTINDLNELIQNGFVLSHIGLQSVLSKPAPDGATYDLEWRIQDVVEFMNQVRPEFPAVKIGIICAAPAHGSPYESWYMQLRNAVVEAGHTLDFIHLDIPFSYPRNGINGLSWSKLVEIENFIRNTLSAEVGMVCTDNTGGMESSNLWRHYVLDGVENYIDAGGRPDALMLFSWYDYPTETIPDALTAIPPGTATQLRVLREVAHVGPPAFLTNPVSKPEAFVHFSYTDSLTGDADNPDHGPLIYEKRSGPSWLSFAPDGGIIGIPSVTDAGLNEWTVRVTDENGRYAESTLEIQVNAGKPIPYSQDFEGVPAGSVPSDFGWQAGAGDYSLVIREEYSYDGQFPLPGSLHENILYLDTGGTNVTVRFSMNESSFPDLYLDAMVRFPAMKEAPVGLLQNPDQKYALYMNPEGYPVLFHGGADGDTGTFTVLDGRFTPETWRRVTIHMDLEGAGQELPVPFFRLWVDGDVQSGNNEGFPDPSLHPEDYTGGSWFRFANYTKQVDEGSARVIREASLHGKGMAVDDFMLTGQKPSPPPRKTYLLVAETGAHGSVVPSGDIQVKSGDYVSVEYIAEEFYEIGSLTSNNEPVAQASGRTTYVWQAFNISAGMTNRVVYEPKIWDVDGKSPLWWADRVGYANGEALTVYEGYLLNQEDLDLPFKLIETGFTDEQKLYVRWHSSGPAQASVAAVLSSDLRDGNVWTEVAGQTIHQHGINIWTSADTAASHGFYRIRVRELSW